MSAAATTTAATHALRLASSIPFAPVARSLAPLSPPGSPSLTPCGRVRVSPLGRCGASWEGPVSPLSTVRSPPSNIQASGAIADPCGVGAGSWGRRVCTASTTSAEPPQGALSPPYFRGTPRHQGSAIAPSQLHEAIAPEGRGLLIGRPRFAGSVARCRSLASPCKGCLRPGPFACQVKLGRPSVSAWRRSNPTHAAIFDHPSTQLERQSRRLVADTFLVREESAVDHLHDMTHLLP